LTIPIAAVRRATGFADAEWSLVRDEKRIGFAKNFLPKLLIIVLLLEPLLAK